MAKRNQNSFLKRQKEIKRQQKAQEKMMRRQGIKKQEPVDELNEDMPIETEEQAPPNEDAPPSVPETN